MNKNKTLLSTLATAAALVLAPAAYAATVIDTGTPNGSGGFPLAFDGTDWVAAKVSFAQATTIAGISGYILGGASGDTFDISLYADGAKPGWQVATTTATYGSAGWNGASDLDWTVAAGTWWIEFEVNWNDTLGSSPFDEGAVFTTGVAHGVPTFTTPDDGFSYFDNGATSIGLQVTTASTVPWPASASTMLAGLALLAALGIARRNA